MVREVIVGGLWLGVLARCEVVLALLGGGHLVLRGDSVHPGLIVRARRTDGSGVRSALGIAPDGTRTPGRRRHVAAAVCMALVLEIPGNGRAGVRAGLAGVNRLARLGPEGLRLVRKVPVFHGVPLD
jgi:hypothetical protein